MIRVLQAATPFVSAEEVARQQPFVAAAHDILHAKSGAGNDFLGWLDLPERLFSDEFARVKEAAATIREQANLLVVIGIGGSYLGAKAALRLLEHSFRDLLPPSGRPLQVVFAGQNMSSTYLSELLEVLDHHEVALNVISKSGTTTEPALAFRVLRSYMERRYGAAEAARRIYATTDAKRGALYALAKDAGYQRFVIPDDVGGRYSVLTPVGLLPIAAAGADIEALAKGARRAQNELSATDVFLNPAYHYAALRKILLQKGKLVELFVNYEPGFHDFGEWWKQLYGESEGKDHTGIFPAAADFSTDLHSLGQFVQEGSRLLFETVLKVQKPRRSLAIAREQDDGDGLNYLAGRALEAVNDTALAATALAHTDGGVPNIVLEVEKMDAEALGYLFYFFEKSCAVSGYLLGINPFDQPGVEAYKKNMFALLGKPGYEALRAKLTQH